MYIRTCINMRTHTHQCTFHIHTLSLRNTHTHAHAFLSSDTAVPTSCFIWKFCTRLRSVNMRMVHRAVSRSDSSKSLKVKSVILRVCAEGTTAAWGQGEEVKRNRCGQQ